MLLFLGIINFLYLLSTSVPSTSLSSFMHCLVRTSHRDSNLIIQFLIFKMYTTQRSARVTWIMAVLASAFVCQWLAKYEKTLLGIPGQAAYLWALFSKDSLSDKLNYYICEPAVGETQPIPKMPSRYLPYWFFVKYLALWQHQISSVTLFHSS